MTCVCVSYNGYKECQARTLHFPAPVSAQSKAPVVVDKPQDPTPKIVSKKMVHAIKTVHARAFNARFHCKADLPDLPKDQETGKWGNTTCLDCLRASNDSLAQNQLKKLTSS